MTITYLGGSTPTDSLFLEKLETFHFAPWLSTGLSRIILLSSLQVSNASHESRFIKAPCKYIADVAKMVQEMPQYVHIMNLQNTPQFDYLSIPKVCSRNLWTFMRSCLVGLVKVRCVPVLDWYRCFLYHSGIYNEDFAYLNTSREWVL